VPPWLCYLGLCPLSCQAHTLGTLNNTNSAWLNNTGSACPLALSPNLLAILIVSKTHSLSHTHLHKHTLTHTHTHTGYKHTFTHTHRGHTHTHNTHTHTHTHTHTLTQTWIHTREHSSGSVGRPSETFRLMPLCGLGSGFSLRGVYIDLVGNIARSIWHTLGTHLQDLFGTLVPLLRHTPHICISFATHLPLLPLSLNMLKERKKAPSAHTCLRMLLQLSYEC